MKSLFIYGAGVLFALNILTAQNNWNFNPVPPTTALFTYEKVPGEEIHYLTKEGVPGVAQSAFIWNTLNENKIYLNQNFILQFNAYFGRWDAEGADGISFVMQNHPDGMSLYPSDIGGHIAYGHSYVSPSYAIEFDTWDNSRRLILKNP